MNEIIPGDDFRQLRDFIYEKSGIFIPDTKRYFLENRLGRRIVERNFKSAQEYLYLLKYGEDRQELSKLFDLVTTNETFFFREPQQLDVFATEVLDRIMAENAQAGRRDIRIWSAACSTGEEPYTLCLMLVNRQGAASFRKDIVASDISEAVLESARAGIYGSYSIRNVADDVLRDFFTKDNHRYHLSPKLKSMVRFLRINLIDSREVSKMRGMDVIFCRNVLIYFDDKAKHRAVANLYDSLRPGGYLIIGTSESLHNITRAFRPVIINRVIVYQKM